MFCNIQQWGVLVLLTTQWIIRVSSTNTTELYTVTTGNASFAQTSSNAAVTGDIPTPFPTSLNMTTQLHSTTALPTAHNTTSARNITTPHPQTINVTSLQQVTTPLTNATAAPFQLPRNVTATVNRTFIPTGPVNNMTASHMMPTARPVNVTDAIQNVTMRHNVTVGRHNITVVPTPVMNATRRMNTTMRPGINMTVGPTMNQTMIMPTARRDNVTVVPTPVMNVTRRLNTTMRSGMNMTARPVVNQTRIIPTARRDNVTVVPTPVMTGINSTRKPHNATQAPPSPTMVLTMTAGPGVNRTRIIPTGHTVTMAVNTTLPPHQENATVAVTHPPTTNYNTEPATTVGSFPACNTTCHRYATCVAGDSGKSCVCNAGYSGDGTTCTLASKKVNLEMRMTSIPFTEDLKDKNSEAFRSLSFKVSRQIFVYLRTTSLGSSLLSVTILNFRQGSVVANYNANFKSNATVSDSGVSSALQQAISKDPNNTLGIDVASLCTKTNEDAACGETAGMDQNLLIGLAVGVPVAAIILLIILGCLIKRARDGKKDEGENEEKKADSGDGEKDENNKNEKKTVPKDSKEDKNPKKDVSLKNGKSQRKSSSSSYGMQQGSFEPSRNYKRMTFQPAVKAGPADKYEHDLGGIYFPKRYHMPQEPKPSFHYVEGHVQGKPVTVVVPI